MAINHLTSLCKTIPLFALVSLVGCANLDAQLYDRYRQRLALADANSAAAWCATGRQPVFFAASYQSRDEACRASNPSPEPPKTVYVEPPPDPPFPDPVALPAAETPSDPPIDPPITSVPEPPRRAAPPSHSVLPRVARSTPIPGNVVATCNEQCPDSPVDTLDQDPHAVLERYRTLSCLQSCTYRELPSDFPNREVYKNNAEETSSQISKLSDKAASPATP